MAHSWQRPGEAAVSWSVALSRRALVAHWHFLVVVLQLNGLLGCSGWPPRWSRAWMCYALVSLVALSTARAIMLLAVIQAAVNVSKNTGTPDDISFIFYLFTCDIIGRAISFLLVQVVVVRHSRDLSLLVRATLLYLRSFSGPKHKRGSRQAVLLCLGANFTFYMVY
ncbi:Gustatory receptor 57, partial [Frankliniella occidentalis]